jgi:hypothetical protein
LTNPSRVLFSLQQNVGIIAACAPTLKPLFARTLNMDTTYGTNNSGHGDGYGPGGSRVISRPKRSTLGYVRETDGDDDNDDFEMGRYGGNAGVVHSRSRKGDDGLYTETTVKGGSGSSDDGSETFILSDLPRDQVVKKTEITVVKTLR